MVSAGRREMSDEMQALAFLAGANSIFTGDKLLTTNNPGKSQDAELFDGWASGRNKLMDLIHRKDR